MRVTTVLYPFEVEENEKMIAVDIAGTWKITITATGGAQTPRGSKWSAIIKVKQDGARLAGTFLTQHGLVGTLTGSISGDEVSLSIEQGPIRPGTFHGFGKVNATNDGMSGTYSGSDRRGGTLQASFTASRATYFAVGLNRLKSLMHRPVKTSTAASIASIVLLLFPLMAFLAAILFYGWRRPVLFVDDPMAFLIKPVAFLVAILVALFLLVYWLLWTMFSMFLDLSVYEDESGGRLPLSVAIYLYLTLWRWMSVGAELLALALLVCALVVRLS